MSVTVQESIVRHLARPRVHGEVVSRRGDVVTVLGVAGEEAIVGDIIAQMIKGESVIPLPEAEATTTTMLFS